jgi:Flp pilus assembly protein TadG
MTRRDKPRGQAMVEFALVFPIFILLLVGLFDFGRVIWVNDTLASAAREAARFAIVHGGSASNTCPMGPAAATAVVPPVDTIACPVYSPSRQAIKDVALSWASGTSSDITVSVCYGAVTSCSGDTDYAGPPSATNARGTQVMVTVTSLVGLSAPALLGFPAINLTATSTMLVNH